MNEWAKLNFYLFLFLLLISRFFSKLFCCRWFNHTNFQSWLAFIYLTKITRHSPRRRRQICGRQIQPLVSGPQDPKCGPKVGVHTRPSRRTCHRQKRRRPSMSCATHWQGESAGFCVGWTAQSNICGESGKRQKRKRALIYNSKPTKGGVLAVIEVIPVHPSLESIQLRVCTRQGF